MSDDIFAELRAFHDKHKMSFVFVHINVNSLRHKFPFIKDVLVERTVDYFAISETKIDNSFPDAQFCIDGFNMYRQDFTATSGGLLIYVRSDLPQRRVKQNEINEDGIESIVLEITIGKTKTIFTCIYKHPKTRDAIFKSKLAKIVDTNFTINNDLVFLGDMNSCPRKSSIIEDICELYDLTNLIKEPTCYKSVNPTLIDVILVTNQYKYIECINTECGLSDFHNIIGAATRRFVPNFKPQRIFYRSYKHFDDDLYCADVQAAPFQVADIFDCPEDAAWYTSALLCDVSDAHAPIKSKTVTRQSVPYMNSRLRKAMYQRNMIRNNFRKFGRSYWEENRRMRNFVTKLRKESVGNYFSKNCSKPNNSFWKTVSPFFTNKKAGAHGNIAISENDVTVTDPTKVSEIFNNHFVTVANNIGFDDTYISVDHALEKHSNHTSIGKIVGHYGENDTNFCFTPVSPCTIEEKLKRFNHKKATGYDNIPGKLIRMAHRELAQPVTKLINTCMKNHIFPEVMKCAEVSPLYKKATISKNKIIDP